MADLALTLFGAFKATLHGEPLQQFRTVKVQALLIYLAAEANSAHRRETLMELLWPGLPLKSAQLNLRQTLFRLRKMIPELTTADGDRKAPFLLSDRLTVRVNPDVAFELDVSRFDKLIRRSRIHNHPDSVSCHECQENMRLAVELYGGSFLADFYLIDSNEFEDWAAAKRGAYRRLALDALDTLSAVELHLGAFVNAQAFARQQLEIDYLDERAYRRLFEALARNGQRNEALGEYDKLRDLLAMELGMEPATRTTEIVELILDGDLSFVADSVPEIRGYELGKKIGAGTMGTIHLAIQPSIGREVAVKVIQPKYADQPEFIRYFESEAQTIARLEHPNIVPLYDYWRDPNGAYLVMRYLRGGNLLSTLEDGPMELAAVTRMLDQVAAALNTAHRQGVVHRDIKPANILLDEDGNSYLTDFGIAKDLTREAHFAAEGVGIGTPEYISPEQIRNEPISPQTDLYSLGAVLYETLTGEKPFPDTSLANLFFLHLNEPVPLVGSSRPDLPAEIDEVIQRATAKRPGDRYVDALEMAKAFRAALGGLEIVEGEPVVIPTVTDLYNPYKGLRAFQEADAQDFFGREALVDQFIARLTDSRFMAVVGPSGSGKSSAVKAGLLPALREGAIPRSEKWFVAEMTPGTHPLEELELALWPIAVDPPPSLVDPMRRDIRGMLRTVRRILPTEQGSQGNEPQLLLVIDQFEELFTLVEDPTRRAFFLDSLMTALNSPRSPLRVVITLRADFYDRPLRHQQLGQLLKENTEIVLPLSSAELTWAIREPARRVGVSLERGLPEAIVADVADQPGALPLLQYAMTELFEHRAGRQLTHQAYDEIGGVVGALSKRAEEIYTRQDANGQEATRQLFLRLVTLGEGVEDTRRRVLHAELNALGMANEQRVEGAKELSIPDPHSPITEVIDAYGVARLLTYDHDPVTRGPTVEVAHEALLREWPRLRGWLDESRNDVRLQRMLATAAAEWKAANWDEGYLLRGARLDQFAGWAGDSSIALTGDETTFLESSIAAREERLAKEAERQRRELETAQKLAETERKRAADQAQAAGRLRQRAFFLTGALVVAAVLAIAAIFFANQSNQNAESAAAEANQRATAQAFAEEQRQNALVQASIGLASQSGLELSGNNPERAVLLALEAIENYPYTWQAESALGRAVFASHLELILPHEGSVNAVRWSPDQTRILTASSDGTARVWDAASGELIFTLDHEEGGEVYTMNWSPTGDRVTTVAANKNIVYIWNAATGQLDLTLEGHQALPWQAAWSPTGDRILTTSLDQTAKIWDAASGEEITTFTGHDDVVHACTDWGDCSDDVLVWSPDGDRVLTNDEAGEIFIWDPVTGEELLHLSGHEEWVNMAAWSPDGRRIVSASDDSTIRIWDAGTGEQIAVYSPTHQCCLAALWSPGSDRVLLYSNHYGSIVIIDPESGERLVALDGHDDGIWAAIWSADGNRILSGSLDGTARIWDSRTGKELHVFRGHSADVNAIEWSPSEDRIVTASADGTAKVWSIAGPTMDFQIPAGGERSDWSPANDLIARSNTVEEEHEIQIFDADTGELELAFPAYTWDEKFIRQVTFSPSGKELLTISGLGPARVWNVEDGTLLTEIFTEPSFIRVSWSPDGTRFATATFVTTFDNGLVQIWDAQTGAELLAFDQHTRIVRGLAWSPDGRRIASASDAGDLLIWDPATGEILYNLLPGDSRLLTGNPVWSADGTRLAAYRDDGSISVWDANTGELLKTISGPGGSARWLSWFASGDRLLAASEDNDFKVWDVDSGSEVLSLTLFGSDAGLSPDGRRFLANVDRAGPLIAFNIWESLDELVTFAKECCVIRELTAEERAEFGLD